MFYLLLAYPLIFPAAQAIVIFALVGAFPNDDIIAEESAKILVQNAELREKVLRWVQVYVHKTPTHIMIITTTELWFRILGFYIFIFISLFLDHPSINVREGSAVGDGARCDQKRALQTLVDT